MTAPAVVRRWVDPPVRVGREVTETGVPAVVQPSLRRAGARTGAAVRARLHEDLVGLRRLAPLGTLLLSGLVTQVGVASHVAPRGAAPDVVLLAVVAVAVVRGARAGAGFGFAAGIGADLFLATPLGTSALAYTLVGHILGRRSMRPRSSRSAAALCSPDSSCFACRTGRRHANPRVAARRAAFRRSIVLAFFGVGVGRLLTAAVATSLGGVPFLSTAGLLRVAGVALVSAPLGPLVLAAVRRMRDTSGTPG